MDSPSDIDQPNDEEDLGADVEDIQDRVGTGEPTVSGRAPAWDDPDEAELTVNIAAVSRLRKLRGSESEAIISGILLSVSIDHKVRSRTTIKWSAANLVTRELPVPTF